VHLKLLTLKYRRLRGDMIENQPCLYDTTRNLRRPIR